MTIILTFIALMLIFGVLVGIHEFGHFFAAKIQGVWVEEFAFGFGPRIFQKKYGDTVYKLNLIPLGGYVKLYGESHLNISKELIESRKKIDSKKYEKYVKEYSLKNVIDDEELKSKISEVKDLSEEEKDELWLFEATKKYRLDDPRRYTNKTVAQRLLIVTMGVIMNFILGVLIYMIYLSMVGGQLIIPNIVDFDFHGVDEQQVLAMFIPIQEDSENNEYSGSAIFEIDGLLISEIKDLQEVLDDKLGENIQISYVQNGIVKNESIELSNDNVDKIFPRYFLLFRSQIQDISAGSIAEKNNFQKGEIIYSIIDSNEEIDLDYSNLGEILEKKEGDNVDFKFYNLENDEFIIISNVDLSKNQEDEKLLLGVLHSPYLPFNLVDVYYLDYDINLLSAFYHSENMIRYQFAALGHIFKVAFQQDRPELIAEAVSGPVRVGAEINNLVKANNFVDLLNLTAIISLTLAFMNILPLPVVDGGHVVLLLLEKMRGRPLSEKSQNIFNIIGLILIVGLSILVTFKDVWQLIFR